MGIQARTMKMWQWILATITAAITIATFSMTLVYSQSEGKALEGRMASMETQVIRDEQRQSEDLAKMRDKIDRIYELLIRIKNEHPTD